MSTLFQVSLDGVEWFDEVELPEGNIPIYVSATLYEGPDNLTATLQLPSVGTDTYAIEVDYSPDSFTLVPDSHCSQSGSAISVASPRSVRTSVQA
jgi:hypothetical protein